MEKNPLGELEITAEGLLEAELQQENLHCRLIPFQALFRVPPVPAAPALSVRAR